MKNKIEHNNKPRKTRSDAGKKRDIDISFSNPQPLEVCPKSKECEYYPSCYIDPQKIDYCPLSTLNAKTKKVFCKYEDWDDSINPRLCRCSKYEGVDCANVPNDVTNCPDYEPQNVSPEFTENDFIIRLCTIVNLNSQHPAAPRKVAELIVEDAKLFGWKSPEEKTSTATEREIYADIVDKLNKAVILHSEIKPNGNVMIKGGAISEILKEYTLKLRALVFTNQPPRKNE
jgi:hypothetical protein